MINIIIIVIIYIIIVILITLTSGQNSKRMIGSTAFRRPSSISQIKIISLIIAQMRGDDDDTMILMILMMSIMILMVLMMSMHIQMIKVADDNADDHDPIIHLSTFSLSIQLSFHPSICHYRSVAPLWVPDSKCSECPKCQQLFSILFRRCLFEDG